MKSTFITRLFETASANASKVAFVDRDGTRSTTYGEMMELACKVAAYIRRQNVPAHSFIAVRMPSCMEYMAAEMGIWMAGYAVVPMGMNYPQMRVDYIMEHSGSPLMLTLEKIQELQAFRNEETQDPEIWIPQQDDNAILLYTSGSTGVPKGVLHTFKSLDYSEGNIGGAATPSPDAVLGFTAPFHFAYIINMYVFLLEGATVHLFGESLKTDVVKLDKYIGEHGITVAHIPPATLNVFHNTSDSLKTVMTAGEKLTSQRSKEGYTLCNQYGMTEILMPFSNEIPENSDNPSIIGKPVGRVEWCILDNEGRRAAPGEEGELCLRGCFCKEYFKDPVATEELYRGGWLHTNDLVRELPDGKILYINRMDWMVKVNGQRVEPGETEAVLLGMEGIDNAVVKGFDNAEGSQYLGAFYISDTRTPDEIRTYLSERLPSYMVPNFLVRMDSFPLNANGKIDRKSMILPRDGSSCGEIVEPEGELETKLMEIVAGLLSHRGFGVTTNLIGQGMTSLTAMKLNAAITGATGRSISAMDILTHPTVRQIAGMLQSSESSGEASATVHQRLDFYPITENQRIIYLEWEKNRDTTQFNLPNVWKLKCADVEKYRKVLCAVIDAHPVLKATFTVKDDDFVMVRSDFRQAEVKVVRLEQEPSHEELASYIRPFNLDGGPLYRAWILAVEGTDTIYSVLDIHHSVCDGLSIKTIVNDISRALSGQFPDAEKYTYFDRSLDEKALLESSAAAGAEEYFDKLLDGLEVTVYPQTDKPHSREKFAVETLELEKDDIDRFCKVHGFTQADYFLTMFLYLLHEVCREEDVLITTINNGRYNVQELDTVGMFVKTLPVTSRSFSMKQSVTDAVKAIQEQFLATRSFDFYPLSRMVEKHSVRSEILFEYQTGIDNSDILKNMNAGKVDIQCDMSITPVTLSVSEGLTDRANYTLKVRYLPCRYDAGNMRNMLRMLKSVSSNGVSAKMMSDIRLIDSPETEEVIALSAGPSLEVDVNQTFAGAFVKCAAGNPDRVAVVDENGEYTYSRLDRASDTLAHLFVKYGVKADDFVALLLERSWFFPLSIIATHKAGAAYTPLDIDYPVDRLQYMLENSRTRLLVTTHREFDRKSAEGLVVDTSEVRTVFLDEIALDAGTKPLNLSTPSGLAYMIYTSGSTGKPKGVMLHQAGLWNFIESIKSLYGHSADDRIASHRAFSFVAHVEDTYAILTVGGSLHIMPSGIRKDLDKIYAFIVDHNITGCGFTTSLAVMMIENYNLPTRYISAGGEKLSGVVSTGHPQIIDVYGPTECTDHTSVHFLETGRSYDNIPVGKTLPNNWSFVLSPEGNLLPQGVAGELCFAGIQVARGYWGLDELTAKSFVDCPFVNEDKWGRKVRMYHTGDLVRWNDEGFLEHLGRIDGQVKIRGFRVEPGEIEAAARSMEGLYTVAVKIADIGGAKHICLYYVPDEGRNIDEGQLRQYVESSSLAEYLRPDYYIRIESMPRLPNGKINRKALPLPQVRQEASVPPETETEKKLLDIAYELLKTDSFGVTSNLIGLGMNSLSAMRLSAVIQRSLGRAVPTATILSKPTIRQIADVLDGGKIAEDTQIAVVHEKREYYPLTENQKGVYLDWEMNRDGLQYNIPLVRTIHGHSADEVKAAVEKVIEAHPVLKARLATVGGEVLIRRRDDTKIDVPVTILDRDASGDYFAGRVLPFNLLEDDLCRVEVVQMPSGVYLFTDIHHIICDGSSSGIIARDLESALNGEEPACEQYTAFDRALDEQTMASGDTFRKAESYFDSLMADYEVASYPKSRCPDSKVPASAHVNSTIRGREITAFCKRHSVTLNSFFLAALTRTLHKILREDSLMMASVTNGRMNSAMQGTVGMFVQTLPVISRASDDTVIGCIDTIQKQFFDTQSNCIFPYTKVVEKYGDKAQILFAYQGGILESGESGKDVRKIELNTSKMPLTIMVWPSGEDFVIDIEYEASMFAGTEIKALADAVSFLAEAAASDPMAVMQSLPLVSQTQAAELEALSKGESISFDTSQTLVDLLREQARRTPDNILVVFKDRKYTYLQMDSITDGIARQLVSLGVKRGEAVGVMIERSELMFAYSMAVMKAGCTYMPLDSHFPEERLSFMCSDAGVGTILTDDGSLVQKALPSFQGKVFGREVFQWAFDAQGRFADIELPEVSPDDRMVILYTSGSTGKPKGVEIEQKSLVNFCYSYIALTSMKEEDRALAYANYGFDAHMMDIYPVMLKGASVHILSEDVRMDLMALNGYIKSNGITVAFLTTQIGCQIAQMFDDNTLRMLSTGGEKMPPMTPPAYRFTNVYGPTECSLLSTFYDVKGHFEGEYIGKPIANYQLYVVDRNLCPVPDGIQGELVVAGTGVARGYLNRPELTREKFISMGGLPAYRSGDLVKWAVDPMDGSRQLEFLGRIDGQIKLRGQRIETGEVENRVLMYEGIRQAFVDVKEIGGNQTLCCYYSLKEGFGSIDEDRLRQFLSEKLAKFMIPEAFVLMESLPLNPNGKVNRKSLPVPELTSRSEYVAPRNDVEAFFCNAMAEVTNAGKVGALDNFFEIGGTSLLAMRLSVVISRGGYNVAYRDIFDNPTPREMAAFVSGTQEKTKSPVGNEDAADTEICGYDYTSLNELAAESVIGSYLNDTSLETITDAVLTGATGYLGIHVLHGLLCNDKVRHIWCISRHSRIQSARSRLSTLLFYYFGETFEEEFGKRLFVIDGDVTDPDAFRQTSEAIKESENVGKLTLFNCAANVKHFSAGTDIEDVNIGGTRNCIDFCLEQGASLVHTSTCSIGGITIGEGKSGLEPHTLLEREFFFGQVLESKYSKSKFLAERYVLEAVRDKGLRAKIMRMGNLAPRSVDGEFQINYRSNSSMGRIKALQMLGIVPYSMLVSRTEFTPIDQAAKAILLLSGTNDRCRVFHILNNHRLPMQDVVHYMRNVGMEVRPVEAQEFNAAVSQALNDPSKASVLQSFLAYTSRSDGKAVVANDYDSIYTSELLARLNFYWEIPSSLYVEQFLNMLKGLGFFDENYARQ